MYMYVCTRRVPTVLLLLLELSRAMEKDPSFPRAGDSGDLPDPFSYGFFVTLGQCAGDVTQRQRFYEGFFASPAPSTHRRQVRA